MEEINLNPTITLKHKIVRSFVLQVVDFFYAEVTLEGAQNIPAVGQPTVYVMNHPNFLLDRLMMSFTLHRRVACMGKSTFFSHPVSRVAMEAFGALPVYRKKDDGLPYGPRGDAAVRNQAILAHCRKLLHQGDGFALFPEGTTHSEKRLLPLQTGAARIALEAEAEANWQGNIQILPVGLWYEDKTKFRSRASVAYGQPIPAQAYRAMYETDPQAAAQAMTDDITEHLKAAVASAVPVKQSEPQYHPLQAVGLSLLLLITLPLALIGGLLNILPARLSGPLTRRFFDQRDTRIATGKMLFNLVFLPLLWLMAAIMVGAIRGVQSGFLFLMTAPFLSYMAVRWLETARNVGRYLNKHRPHVRSQSAMAE